MNKGRLFWCSLFLSLVLFLLAAGAGYSQETETEPADNYQIEVYLTEEEALKLIFPESDDIVADEIIMTPEEKQNLEQILKRRLFEDRFTVYAGRKNNEVLGYAIITEEIGKFHPFTFIVGVKPNGKISNIAVLVYRESRGGEIAKKRFLYQFIGKSLKNPIRINKDIINITGATMSVQCMCAGVRKVLGVIDEYYLNGKRDVNALRRIAAATNAGEDNTASNTNNQSVQSVAHGNEKSKKNADGSAEKKLVKQTRMIMGTFAEVSVYSDDVKKAEEAIDAALNEMERMDAMLSNYKKDSELSRVNKGATKSPVPCTDEFLEFLEQSLFFSELSDGAFDITVSPIVSLWGFFDENGHIPPEEEINRLLPAVSYKNIEIKRNGNNKEAAGTVFYKNISTQIDPGAIGKGYAVDKALNIIKNHDVDNACINLGGNVYALGNPAGKNAWKIGVQHPRDKNEILGYLELRDEATATSGDYERFFEINGIRYSHIIDPRTGNPVKGTIAVTIIAPSGTDVDALSTSVFVLGPEKGFGVIREVPGAEAFIACEKEGKIVIYVSQGFDKKFTKVENEGKTGITWHVVSADQQ
ncbi:MAG: FMN-binding protein [Planctomycetes bacterium]|nr:FMN-binding protein [Planctomycetota bacterium]